MDSLRTNADSGHADSLLKIQKPTISRSSSPPRSLLPLHRRPSENLPELVPEESFPEVSPVSHGSLRTEVLPSYGEAEAYDLQHRLSNKGRKPRKPSSAGLESVWDGEYAKEVVYPACPAHKEGYFEHPEQLSSPQEIKSAPDAQSSAREGNYERKCCGVRKKWLFILIALAITLILAIALGVGLGVGLGRSSRSSSPSVPANTEYLIGGAISPAFYSSSGAFNGSGIALASQSFSSDLQTGTQGSIVMYFQHYTGQIRWMQLTDDGQWVGGSPSEVVAVDAKNSTPLSAVSYSINGSDMWHVFYIDHNNVIKQRSNSNTSNVWIDGSINNAHLIANDADQVGMQACWYGNDYGDSDYKHTPLPSGTGDFSLHYGMRIWYASDDNTFKQLGWRFGESSWTEEGEFPDLNGHAGVGCYSWGPGSVTYAMFVNTKDEVEFYWRDTNTSLPSTASHPINKWTKAPLTIPDVDPATSLGYTNFFYAQMADTHMMNGFNISWAAENTSLILSSDFTVAGDAGLPGTHLSVSAIPGADGGNNIVVFYQTEGDDITEYTRDLVAGQWSTVDIQIPQQ